MRVKQAEHQAGKHRAPKGGRWRVAGGLQCGCAAPGRYGIAPAIPEQKHRAPIARQRHHPRPALHQYMKAAHAYAHKHHIERRAGKADGKNVFFFDALAQHKGVLRANGNDKRQGVDKPRQHHLQMLAHWLSLSLLLSCALSLAAAVCAFSLPGSGATRPSRV